MLMIILKTTVMLVCLAYVGLDITRFYLLGMYVTFNKVIIRCSVSVFLASFPLYLHALPVRLLASAD